MLPVLATSESSEVRSGTKAKEKAIEASNTLTMLSWPFIAKNANAPNETIVIEKTNLIKALNFGSFQLPN